MEQELHWCLNIIEAVLDLPRTCWRSLCRRRESGTRWFLIFQYTAENSCSKELSVWQILKWIYRTHLYIKVFIPNTKCLLQMQNTSDWSQCTRSVPIQFSSWRWMLGPILYWAANVQLRLSVSLARAHRSPDVTAREKLSCKCPAMRERSVVQCKAHTLSIN